MSVDLLDRELLSSLRIIMDDDFATLLQVWWQDSGEKMAQLHQAVRQNDHEKVRRIAHSLKGSGSNLGLLALNAVCQALELNVVTTNNLNDSATENMLVQLQQTIHLSAEALQQETGVPLAGVNTPHP